VVVLDPVMRPLADPDAHAGGMEPAAVRDGVVADHMVGDVRFQLLVLLSSVGVVLLIACANVASLTLARVASRNTELTVRKALGASAGRIVRQAVTESLVLASIGGIAGIVIGAVGVRALVALAPADLPRLYDVRMSGAVLAFTLAATVITGLLFGVIPAVNAGSANPGERLRGSRGATDRFSGVVRRGLVVAEVALAVVLMAGAGLLLRSFVHLLDVKPGFTVQGVTTFGIALPPKYEKPEQQRLFTSTLLEQIEKIPGVSAAGTSFALPLTGESFGFTFDISGRVTDPKNEPRAQARIADPGYFAAMGIPLLRGRMFDERDRAGAAQTLVISAELAHRYFPNEDPIGKTLTTGWGDQALRFKGEVIGVVGDVRQFGLNEPAAAHMYMTSAQWPLNEYNVVVRSSTQSEQLITAIQQVIRRLDQNVPMIAPRPFSRIVGESIGQPRFVLTLLSIFAIVALLLAAVGLYGLIAYGVHTRRREIGIRLALGATHGRVATMVLGEGVRLVAVGAAIGIAGALMLTSLLKALLFEVSARDPMTIAAAPMILMGVAIIACVVPARHAAALDPVETMRTD
jgi:predicted permease